MEHVINRNKCVFEALVEMGLEYNCQSGGHYKSADMSDFFFVDPHTFLKTCQDVEDKMACQLFEE